MDTDRLPRVAALVAVALALWAIAYFVFKSGFGGACHTDRGCRGGGVCIHTSRVGGTGYCSRECTAHVDCPSGYACDHVTVRYGGAPAETTATRMCTRE